MNFNFEVKYQKWLGRVYRRYPFHAELMFLNGYFCAVCNDSAGRVQRENESHEVTAAEAVYHGKAAGSSICLSVCGVEQRVHSCLTEKTPMPSWGQRALLIIHP